MNGIARARKKHVAARVEQLDNYPKYMMMLGFPTAKACNLDLFPLLHFPEKSCRKFAVIFIWNPFAFPTRQFEPVSHKHDYDDAEELGN